MFKPLAILVFSFFTQPVLACMCDFEKSFDHEKVKIAAHNFLIYKLKAKNIISIQVEAKRHYLSRKQKLLFSLKKSLISSKNIAALTAFDCEKACASLLNTEYLVKANFETQTRNCEIILDVMLESAIGGARFRRGDYTSKTQINSEVICSQ